MYIDIENKKHKKVGRVILLSKKNLQSLTTMEIIKFYDISDIRKSNNWVCKNQIKLIALILLYGFRKNYALKIFSW
ncbi:hypothetical protein ASD98_19690 [Flavobacterium sp. Root186]|nr:hypothetical protein ASD98_19690 [Flavobacterium sp. Root186]